MAEDKGRYIPVYTLYAKSGDIRLEPCRMPLGPNRAPGRAVVPCGREVGLESITTYESTILGRRESEMKYKTVSDALVKRKQISPAYRKTPKQQATYRIKWSS